MNGNDNPQDQANITNGQPAPPTPEAGNADPTGQPATAQQLEQTETRIEERMSGFERSMIRLTRAGVVIGIITGLIFAGQLYEMISGGTQTDKLLTYAGQQTQAATDMATAGKDFSKSVAEVEIHTRDAVTAMQKSADASKQSAETAIQALEIANRPAIRVENTGTYINPEKKILEFKIFVKNFSNAIAYDSVVKSCTTIEGHPHELPQHQVPTTPIDIAPQEGFHMDGVVIGPQYDAVMAGAHLNVTMIARYNGSVRNKHYTYCEKYVFDPKIPGGEFASLGGCEAKIEAPKMAADCNWEQPF